MSYERFLERLELAIQHNTNYNEGFGFFNNDSNIRYDVYTFLYIDLDLELSNYYLENIAPYKNIFTESNINNYNLIYDQIIHSKIKMLVDFEKFIEILYFNLKDFDILMGKPIIIDIYYENLIKYNNGFYPYINLYLEYDKMLKGIPNRLYGM